MVVLKDVGECSTDSGAAFDVVWKIPDFYELPQDCDTVIRSPRLRCKGREWCIEVYPNGRSLYCSSDWFGIGALNLNSDSTYRRVALGIGINIENFLAYTTDSCEHGLYSCMKFLPTSLLKSARNSLILGGNLLVYFDAVTEIPDQVLNTFVINLSIENAVNFFNAYKQVSGQTEQQIVKEERKQKQEVTCGEELPQSGKENKTSSEITDVGEIVEEMDIKKWIIPNFYDLSQEYNTILRSPRFCIKDREWHVQVYPNGCSSYDCSSGWFGIGIFNLNADTSSRISVQFGTSIEGTRATAGVNLHGKSFYNYMKFLPTLFLKSGENSLLHGGNLHVHFDANTDTKDVEQDEIVIILKREDAEKCFDVCVQAARQTTEEIGVERLLKDFKEILLNENISDVILKVDGQEFKAHRCILAARSPVFLAMMTHETKEKTSGIVDIADVDSNIFSNFLHYLYTGSLKNLTSQNAAQLYTVADRYQVDELKKTCVNNMLANISVDNFCDVIVLSLQHTENDLKEACIGFFLKHSLDIVLSSKWQTFLTENPIIGNKLFIKHLQIKK